MTKIIDMHCDALSKLLENPHRSFAKIEQGMDVSLPYLQQSGVLLQNFAIYLSERTNQVRMEEVFRCVDLFRRKIIDLPEVTFIRTSDDLQKLAQTKGTVGALLSLEGADALGGELLYVRLLFELGLRMIGITWNHANWAADGVMEPRQGGFTLKGKQFVKECNRMGMLMDVSHLCETGFWELIELSHKPLAASHSNAYAVCAHPRNLKDGQIRAIAAQDGWIGLTFVPYFVSSDVAGQVTPDRLLRHIEHMCELGAERNIGFGSDFDGIEQWIAGLEHAGKYDTLANLLYKNYRSEEAEGFLCGNVYRYLLRELPKSNV